jgi:hypothetical protein
MSHSYCVGLNLLKATLIKKKIRRMKNRYEYDISTHTLSLIYAITFLSRLIFSSLFLRIISFSVSFYFAITIV